MKLYECPCNTIVRVVSAEAPPPGGRPHNKDEIINFHHLDGMYSFCTNQKGEIVHLKAWTEVEPIGPMTDPR
jgi:hypothetical protein